jgi:hypothetical protein
LATKSGCRALRASLAASTGGQDRKRALAAFEWGTLFALRVALRNGSVFLDHSFAFRSQATMLISGQDWQARRNHFYGHLKLPQDARAFWNLWSSTSTRGSPGCAMPPCGAS